MKKLWKIILGIFAIVAGIFALTAKSGSKKQFKKDLKDNKEKLKDVKTPMTVALMGCAVNGPGEASHTDLGIAFGKGAGHLYYQGENRGKISEDQAMNKLEEMISEFETSKQEE